MVRVAVAAGAVGILALAVVLVTAVWEGDRPEERLADTFLTALFSGEGDAVYDLTTPAYRSLVFVEDLRELSEAFAITLGPVDVTVLGSERTPGTEPPESFVGYRASSDVGIVEGVLVALELGQVGWRVRDVSYRFPEAEPQEVAELLAFLDRLNQQVAERARSAGR